MNNMDFGSAIENTVADFDAFLDYIESENPPLSLKRGELGKKDSFRLNQLLHYRKDVCKPNYTQYQYPVLHLLFFVALEGDLYVKAHQQGRGRLLKTSAYEQFRQLNMYEKYTYLIQTYWTKYDFWNNFSKYLSVNYFYDFLKAMANSKKPQWVVKEGQFNLDIIYAKDSSFYQQLHFFGFGDYQFQDEQEAFYKDSIKDFRVNALGIYASRFLIQEALALWNNPLIENLMAKKKKPFPKVGEPFAVFRQFFPSQKVENTITYVDEFDRSGVYTFKVSLCSSIWRKIRIAHYHSLEDLHFAIQEAFDFDHDHLYAFYVGGNQRTGKAICGVEVEEEDWTADRAAIADLKLFKGQKFFYLFDFGDEWWFELKLVDIDQKSPFPPRPEIIAQKGKSPQQYPDWDAED
ncbi:MAG: IS1096 element passenger TnpR family protein [Actinomycetota bacterium]